MAGPILQINARERRLLTVLAFFGAVVAVLLVPIGVDLYVRSEVQANDELRQALSDVQEARSRIRERQAKKDAIVARYARKAPALAGYLDKTAHAQKLEIPDSTPLPDVPHGKRYVEHGTSIHLKKTGLLGLSKFLETIEQSGFPIVVSRLGVRKRSAEPDSYDVEVAVSSYDRSEPPATPAPVGSAGGTKP
jgi:general secretion pathway protein M